MFMIFIKKNDCKWSWTRPIDFGGHRLHIGFGVVLNITNSIEEWRVSTVTGKRKFHHPDPPLAVEIVYIKFD